MEHGPTLKTIDDAANMWNKTKDSKYKNLWYKLIKDNYGSNNSKRRIVSVSSCNKNDNGEYLVIGRSRLFRSV